MRLRADAVWAAGDRPLRHDIVGFVGRFEWDGESRCRLRIAAASVYRVWLNGEFLAAGPARCAKGFFRVDEIDLDGHSALFRTENVVAVEVVHYGVNGYSNIDQPPFLLAEVLLDGHAVLWTHPKQGGFEAHEVPGRLRRVARYSYQRPFSEAYRLTPDWDDWLIGPFIGEKGAPVVMEFARAGEFLPRRSPMPEFRLRQPSLHVAKGTMERIPNPQIRKDWSVTEVGNYLGGYREGEWEVAPMHELQTFSISHQTDPRPYDPTEIIILPPNETMVIDLGVNRTGFLGLDVVARTPARLILSFDEVLTSAKVDHTRLGCANAILLELEPGSYAFETAEPYTCRYLELCGLEGNVEFRAVTVREVVNPHASRVRFSCSDQRLNRIFQAAIETLGQNAVDIPMDCPSRERAGWLCDSFFTCRALWLASGDTGVETDFLENYALPDRFDDLPEGMIPMCYPADHPNGQFIPQWSMWFVLQLEEYLSRSHNRDLLKRLVSRLEGLLAFYRQFENEDGLLERLPKWNFVEWSKANEWMQDVNYPTNMLYAATLHSLSRLLERPDLEEEAAQVRRKVHEQSHDGTFFVDNATRVDSRLMPTGNRSEVCQYFAFFFGTASEQTHPELWRILMDEFGPKRKETNAYPEIAPANMFVGEVMRLDLLSRGGRSQQVLDDLVGYLLKMADTTGTLWENNTLSASANHGFASHAIVWLLDHALGLSRPDNSAKTVVLRPPVNDLQWCEGSIPTREGEISFSWRREADGVYERTSLPAGYRRVS